MILSREGKGLFSLLFVFLCFEQVLLHTLILRDYVAR